MKKNLLIISIIQFLAHGIAVGDERQVVDPTSVEFTNYEDP